MCGTSAGQKTVATAGRKTAASQSGYRPHYQGLLQVPKLSEIFDHQIIKSNIEQENENNKSVGKSNILDEVEPKSQDIFASPNDAYNSLSNMYISGS